MQYYLVISGKKAGPFTEEIVQEMLSNGQVKPEQLCWCSGLKVWTPLIAVFPSLRHPPIPVTTSETLLSYSELIQRGSTTAGVAIEQTPEVMPQKQGQPRKGWRRFGEIYFVICVIGFIVRGCQGPLQVANGINAPRIDAFGRDISENIYLKPGTLLKLDFGGKPVETGDDLYYGYLVESKNCWVKLKHNQVTGSNIK